MDLSISQNNLWIIALLVVWELVWKGLALWKAAHKNQRNWFIALLVINTIGVLPILYLLFFHKGKYYFKEALYG